MKIEISSIVENQLPLYVREEYPLAAEFLKQYYISDNSTEIVHNLEEYLDLDIFFDLPESTVLSSDIESDSSTIIVTSTQGFPETYGLLKIDDEIITYISKTDTAFEGCVRGFSGVDRVNANKLVFTQTSANFHYEGAKVYNLSSIFLKEFLFKTKQKIAPGFENRSFTTELNQSSFLKRVGDFYKSKGTEESFRILFAALYGKDVKLVLPRDQLFSASNAQYRVTKKLVVESLQGNPKELVNSTIYQDSDGFIQQAQGTITYVEKIFRGGKDYFIISVDYDYDKDIDVSGSIKSDFSIHPQTLIINDVKIGSNFIDVDSTVGFPNSGKLIVKKSGIEYAIQYTSKTLTQFLGCSGISIDISAKTPVRLDVFAYGFNADQEVIKLRITGVLTDPIFNGNNYFYNPGEKAEITSLGIKARDLKSNEWIFNIPLSYNISELLIEAPLVYKVSTIDDHVFVTGDSASFVDPSNTLINGTISAVLNSKSVLVETNLELDLNKIYYLRKNLSKVNFENSPDLNIYNANVQNSYLNYDKEVFVLSSSLPSYLNTQLNANTGKAILSGFATNELNITNHQFYTGDSVVYKKNSNVNSPILDGIYFIKKVNENTIKLCLSRENINQNQFIEFSGDVTGSTLEFYEFTDSSLQSKTIQPQNIIRKLVVPRLSGRKTETALGAVGLLKNGVEIANYKSSQQIFYGPLTKVIASSPGDNYDIINPSTLNVDDSVGVGATVLPNIRGTLKRIDLLDSGFDYLDTPDVIINGGNGNGAIAVANLIETDHIEYFNANTEVDLTTDTVGFSTYHKFRQAEEIIYDSSNQTPVSGLISGQKYYVFIKSPITVSIHSTKDSAVLGINSIDLSAKSSGIHNFKAVNKKNVVGSISVINEGLNYEYKKVPILGITTSLNQILVKDHNFKDGEKVYYTSEGVVSSGLSNNTSYYVTVVDSDNVKLSQINLSGEPDFYYKTRQFISINSQSDSSQFLSYPPITVEIKGRIGVATFNDENYNAKFVPVFRGGIVGATIQNGGSSYGNPEILNYKKQPKISPIKGSGAQLRPVISGGKITDVIILSPGTNYHSQPDILISGDGFNAVLTPIVTNGIISDVKVISGGFNYTQEKTFITIVAPGEGANFETFIKSWRVNIVEKYGKYLSDDEGIILPSRNQNSGLQYYHFYAPRNLRRSVYSKTLQNGNVIYKEDLQLDQNGNEIDSTLHSPIIGWAYDGNPIYGPFGYDPNFNGTKIKQIFSGYSKKTIQKLTSENRPSTDLYPIGFFVEDYEFTSSGDLDENNGRYCVTPEFLNGTYAYFATFEASPGDNGFKKAEFPYLIGQAYYSEPINFNFDPKSNQNDIDINSLSVLRNVTPYNLTSENSFYEGLIKPFEIKNEFISIKSTSPNKIDSISVISNGDGYRVGDIIDIENNNTAKVSKISGKAVSSIASSIKSLTNVEVLAINNEIIGFSTIPHALENNDFVYFSAYNGKTSQDFVKIQRNQLILAKELSDVATTGIVTYLNVFGDLINGGILPNDIYKINNEQIKILSVDPTSSRLWINRAFNGTSGVNTHQVGTALTEFTRKFKINNSINLFSDKINQEYYFNPKESVALGLTHGVGVNSTLYFSNPGVGETFKYIPTRTIYLPNHKLNTNDQIIYNNYGNASISISTNGITTSSLVNNSVLYAVKVSSDLIGISSNPIGLGSTGSYVGIGNTIGLLYFYSAGIGSYHSFNTVYNTLNADLTSQQIIVSTATTNNLLLNDKIYLQASSGINTTFIVKYNEDKKVVISKEKIISNILISEDILVFDHHDYVTGEKVIYISSGSLISGLIDNKTYYVIAISNTKIKLALSQYDALNGTNVAITTIGDGVLKSINPLIRAERNSSLTFDLSDSSLSYNQSGALLPAFEFKIFSDYNKAYPYYNNGTKNSLNFSVQGKIGVDSTAKAVLVIDDVSPSQLYYDLIPVFGEIPSVKKEKIVDNEQISNNTIQVVDVKINNTFDVISTTNNSFTIVPDKQITPFLYASNNGISYATNSNSETGGIEEVQITKNNVNNYKIPSIVKINSIHGKGAELRVISQSIGAINAINLDDIGFEYSIDSTVKPYINLPKIVKTEPLYTLEKITVTQVPVNYFSKPNLVLFDNYYDSVVDDVVLDYNITQNTVEIVTNVKSIRGTEPFIIPTNNSVGIAISDISFNNTTKDVTVTLDVGYSDIEDFPFVTGDKVLIENVVVGQGEKGYNSSLYNYSLFTIKTVDPKIGGIGATITYSMENYLDPGETLGTYNRTVIKGSIVPEKYFPFFDIKLGDTSFIEGEIFYSEGSTGELIDQNIDNNYIKVNTSDNLLNGSKIIGQSSKTEAIISEVIEFEANLDVKSSSRVVEGWNRETGFFNNNLQRIHDNNYYQYFSYSLKSEVNYFDWNETVDDLVHPAGFKKFSDLIVYSESPDEVGFSTNVSVELLNVNEITSDIDMNVIDNFALAKENSFYIDNILNSNEIYFEGVNIQDYIESVSNRVLKIDDFILDFSLVDSIQKYALIDAYRDTEYHFKKYFIAVRDKWNPENSAFSLVTTLQNETDAILTQYSEVSNSDSLGYFDIENNNNRINFNFYPTNYEYSSYYLNSMSFGIGVNYSGISTLSVGNISSVRYFGQTHSVGTGVTAILGISTDVRAAKLLIGIAFTDNSHYELDEITFVNNGSEIYHNNYGELKLTNSQVSIGTFNLYLSGGQINVDFTPSSLDSQLNYKTSIVVESILNTSISGVGSTSIDSNYIVSTEKTTSGISTELFKFDDTNTGSYSLICVHNLTTSEYSVCEFSTLYNSITNNVYYVEFGSIDTNTPLGITSAYVQNNEIIVSFTPSTAGNYNIRTLSHIVSSVPSVGEIGINSNFNIASNYNLYEAAIFGVKSNFELLSNNLPIFSRTFDGSSSVGVNTTNNTIIIPNHYFVTGEEVEYTYEGSPIGIGTTLVGAGVTDTLPNKVYIVKVNDLEVRVAASASFALQSIPKTFEFRTLGVGTQHTFTSTSQNNRSLICVDNIIQSPIVSTAKTTTLENKIGFFDSKLPFNNVDELSAGDLLKLDDEIVKILSVGVGSTNVCLVDRAKLGTELDSHSSGSLVTKINGNYNIIGNSIHYEAPTFVSDENYKYSYEFTGRVFLRSGIPNSLQKTYYDNYIFDDISSEFNGIKKTFTLTENKNNVIDIDDRNAIVLINNVFQAPQFDYFISENSGISSINFTGAATSFTYDVNNASIPRGGIIVSAGSTAGLGYQPLVCAGGTATVSAAGTIQSVAIGNSGSGYRKDLQIVRVGVQTESTGTPNIQFIGTATVSNGNVVSVAITNTGIGYTAYPIKYDTRTSTSISIGTTVLPLEIVSGVTTSDFVSIDPYITNASITGIGTTFITIGTADTSGSLIPIDAVSNIKSYNPPKVIFDDPLPYSNIPLIYANGSSGSGVEATISIVVGQGSSVISFELINSGYAYKAGEKLTVAYGGNAGIPTDTSIPFSPFILNIDSTFTDQFISWTIGDLQSLDSFDRYFDGTRKNFQLRQSNVPISIQKKTGSTIDLASNLLIFINDVLQKPGVSYNFDGGSIVSFIEAPQKTDKSKVVFYKGTSTYDIVDVDIVEEIKIGDELTLNSEILELQENSRMIFDINSTDTVVTNLYSGPGITTDENLERIASIRRQTEDIIINGQIVGKNRSIYEPIITPSTKIISNVGIANSQIFVESLRTFFDNKKEYLNTDTIQRKIRIISQNDSLFESETISNVSYDGDFGFVSGINTTTIGVGSTGLIFDLYIPPQSPLRTDSYLSGTTSGIKTGYYFVVSNTNIGNGVISLENDETVLGIGTTFIDNVYKAYSVSIAQTSVPGFGVTDVVRVTTKVDRDISGIGFSGYYGDYSWGRIHSFIRTEPKQFIVNPSGISTSAIVQRVKQLKYENYYT